jgi:hypothetical protein
MTTPRSSRLATALAVTALAVGACAAGPCAAGEINPAWRNLTTGGPLRPGIYGRIVIKRGALPPPVIYPQPVVANHAPVPDGVTPIYLYVPPGQVRKWKQSCVRWAACGTPVLFVRVEHSPSQWGNWRELREDIALHEREYEDEHQ